MGGEAGGPPFSSPSANRSRLPGPRYLELDQAFRVLPPVLLRQLPPRRGILLPGPGLELVLLVVRLQGVVDDGETTCFPSVNFHCGGFFFFFFGEGGEGRRGICFTEGRNL